MQRFDEIYSSKYSASEFGMQLEFTKLLYDYYEILTIFDVK